MNDSRDPVIKLYDAMRSCGDWIARRLADAQHDYFINRQVRKIHRLEPYPSIMDFYATSVLGIYEKAHKLTLEHALEVMSKTSDRVLKTIEIAPYRPTKLTDLMKKMADLLIAGQKADAEGKIQSGARIKFKDVHERFSEALLRHVTDPDVLRHFSRVKNLVNEDHLARSEHYMPKGPGSEEIRKRWQESIHDIRMKIQEKTPAEPEITPIRPPNIVPADVLQARINARRNRAV